MLGLVLFLQTANILTSLDRIVSPTLRILTGFDLTVSSTLCILTRWTCILSPTLCVLTRFDLYFVYFTVSTDRFRPVFCLLQCVLTRFEFILYFSLFSLSLSVFCLLHCEY